MVSCEQRGEQAPNKGDFVRFFSEQPERTIANNTGEQVQNTANNNANRFEHSESANPNSRGEYGPRRGPTPGADVRARLTGLKAAKAGQILTILERVKFSVSCDKAIPAVQAALTGCEFNPKEVLAELLTVANACRGEKTLTGSALQACAANVFLPVGTSTLGGQG